MSLKKKGVSLAFLKFIKFLAGLCLVGSAYFFITAWNLQLSRSHLHSWLSVFTHGPHTFHSLNPSPDMNFKANRRPRIVVNQKSSSVVNAHPSISHDLTNPLSAVEDLTFIKDKQRILSAPEILNYYQSIESLMAAADAQKKEEYISIAQENVPPLISCLNTENLCLQKPDHGFFDASITPAHHMLSRFLEIMEFATRSDSFLLRSLDNKMLIQGIKIQNSTIPLVSLQLLLRKQPTDEVLVQAFTSIDQAFSETRAHLLTLVARQDGLASPVRKALVSSIEKTFEKKIDGNFNPETLDAVLNKMSHWGLRDNELRSLEIDACENGISIDKQLRMYALKPKKCKT